MGFLEGIDAGNALVPFLVHLRVTVGSMIILGSILYEHDRRTVFLKALC